MALKDELVSLKQRVPVAGRLSYRARRAVALARRESRHVERWTQAALDQAFTRRLAGVGRSPFRGRPRLLSVSVDRLLLGGGDGSNADDGFARPTGDLSVPSTPLPRWPQRALDQHGSSRESVISVAAAKRSDCFMVLAGHQTAAAAHAAGATELDVAVVGRPRWTPFQHVILDMGWLDSRAELYQPVASPELEEWPVVRTCQDRLDHMIAFLTEYGPASDRNASFLDVASCYGWFVARMLGYGYDARGIEIEPVAPAIGLAAYGLEPARIAVGDSVVLLERQPAADVLSCFSLAHHFVLGRGSCSAEELVGLLARRTRRVLFFEMGQDHEAWFRHSLAGWNSDSVRDWLLQHTDFDHVIALGVDHDSRPPYKSNYGRTLFACVRRQT